MKYQKLALAAILSSLATQQSFGANLPLSSGSATKEHSNTTKPGLVITADAPAPHKPELLLSADTPDAHKPVLAEPMHEFPLEQKVPAANVVDKPKADEPPKVLKLTSAYFCNEKNPKAAYQEACSQQDAHFNEPAYYYRKATILIQMGNYSKAEQQLKDLLVDIPNNSDYHIARAYCYYKMGKKTAAQDEIGMARFHNPRLPESIEFDD
jgi:tetratricopeptide (TPR) repeat protein